MKKILFAFVFSIITCCASAEFTTNAKSAFLVDYDSGAEIFSKNADVLMPPSSMIKLMTLAVLFDEIKAARVKMDDRFPVSENANYKNPLWYPASKICLVTGQTISVRDLILGLIVLSGGDASVVVAEKLAGDENKFTAMMQNKAHAIGMEKSTFGNASGLPHPNNLMTSRELAILAKHIISDYPDIYPILIRTHFTSIECCIKKLFSELLRIYPLLETKIIKSSASEIFFRYFEWFFGHLIRKMFTWMDYLTSIVA